MGKERGHFCKENQIKTHVLSLDFEPDPSLFDGFEAQLFEEERRGDVQERDGHYGRPALPTAPLFDPGHFD